MREFTRQLTSELQFNQDEYEKYAEELRTAVYSSCSVEQQYLIADYIFCCFGFCSESTIYNQQSTSCWTVGLASVETSLSSYLETKDIADAKLEEMKQSVLAFVNRMEYVTKSMEHEKSKIVDWDDAAKELGDEINQNEVEYLTEFKADRRNFLHLVEELQKAA